MQTLIISDIHANLTALEAVLSDAGEFDQVWFLGDLVGYGPDPNECIVRVRALPHLVALMGNHDAAALGHLNLAAFNATARQAVYWTQKNTTAENLAYLESLPAMTIASDDVTLAHGSPRQPVWEYILDARTAWENFQVLNTDYCFVGHSHLPSMFYLPDRERRIELVVPEPNTSYELSPRMIINPGSVGQPRDRDPRAAYALLDTDHLVVEFRRVDYDILAVQERMQAAGLPERHIVRLKDGW